MNIHRSELLFKRENKSSIPIAVILSREDGEGSQPNGPGKILRRLRRSG
jgi:hypothetical protein